ncbi:hypothetical protein [Natronorubrum texcoconense]|uniref:DUF8108 domain-containing protein n=1 Tax=Natronorubrum texcoconense TaxID=1095776 RepID=A0A1G8UK10_9EURY|nr:hypothetical protein [Natronorubrum texcoconense]SDJ53310.1 hypothetical protein SAMN04515672_0894 [Natronorubrum texcoconense]
MSNSRSNAVELADRVSALLYGVAGWLLVGFGLLFGLVGAGNIVAGATQGAVVGYALLAVLWLVASFVLVAFGIFVNPEMRRRLDRRHSPSAFGRVRSVDRRVVRSDEDCDERCVACDSRVERGLVRRYREEYALAGLPVYTRKVDYNYYCLECATAELSDESAASDGSRDVERGRRTADDRHLERR